MNPLQKSIPATGKSYFNLRQLALYLLLCIIAAIFITSCAPSTASSDESSLKTGDISLVTAGIHPAYSAATVSVTGNTVTISGIKNKEDGFEQALTLTIGAEYQITERGAMVIGADNALTLAGTKLNPAGVGATNTINDEDLTFTVISVGTGSVPVKYYVHLVLGDLIQLKFLSGNAGDFASEVLLSEGTSSSAANTVTLKDCGVVTGSLSHEVLVGGSVSTAYALTGTVNPYVASAQTNFVLSESGTERANFSLMIVAPCSAAALSGAGTSGDPYIIDNDRKLNLVAELINANMGNYKTAHYRVTERIDLGVAQAPWSEVSSTSSDPNGSGFSPINFNGTFDCETNEIANLYINRGDVDNIGLFGLTLNATIRNCGLTAVKVTGRASVGGLVGKSSNNSAISSSYVTGSVSGVSHIGGLVGISFFTIDNSYATASVTGGDSNIGGLVGSASTINGSYATGDVSGRFSVGGLVGESVSSATISNSYATGNVLGTGMYAGGLFGRAFSMDTIASSYAIGSVTGSANNKGGLVGESSGMVTGSYWDTETTGQSGSAGGTGQTTTQLQSATSYTGWLDTVWQFAPNNQYPRLKTVVCANRQYNQAATECTGL